MLSNYIRDRSYAIVAGYDQAGEIVAVLGAMNYLEHGLRIRFPVANPFEAGQNITFHLDDRTGAEEFDASLRVHRVSVKARVVESQDNSILVALVEYQMRFSNKIQDSYWEPGYAYPADSRQSRDLEPARLSQRIVPDPQEQENKLGVLITRAIERPHTTVMAFLSSTQDDIFIVSHRGSFKSQLIHRDPSCVFAIDHRSSYHFERAIHWNYTLIHGRIRVVPPSDPRFADLQHMFVDKNPWEYAFFTDPRVEMFHIEPGHIICPADLSPEPGTQA